MKYLITIISILLPTLYCVGQSTSLINKNCTSLSEEQFEDEILILKDLSNKDFLEESKVFVEKYCIDNSNLSVISAFFETDQDRIEFLYHAFSHSENLSIVDGVDFHFEDNLYQEIFISFLNDVESTMSNELTTAELEGKRIKNDKENLSGDEEITTKVVYVPDYRGRIGVEKPMSSTNYFEIQKAIQLEHLSNNKVDVFINRSKGKGISVQQLDGILSLYNYENDKMKVFSHAVEKIYDLDNLAMLKHHFINLFNKKEIDRITNQELNKYMTDRIALDDNIEYHHN